MQIRDRIREFRRVKAGQLRPSPRNWRRHPQAQQDAMRGLLAEIGYAGALIARQLPDGSLELVDGHLRAETTPDLEVPVLVVDLDDREAAKLLALFDPLGAMAEADAHALDALLASVETENEALEAMLARMRAEGEPSGADEGPASPLAEGPDVPELFQVVVECENESQQRALFERLTREGLHCRLLVL